MKKAILCVWLHAAFLLHAHIPASPGADAQRLLVSDAPDQKKITWQVRILPHPSSSVAQKQPTYNPSFLDTSLIVLPVASPLIAVAVLVGYACHMLNK